MGNCPTFRQLGTCGAVRFLNPFNRGFDLMALR